MRNINWRLILFLIFFFGVIAGAGYLIYIILFQPTAPTPIVEAPIVTEQPTTVSPGLLPPSEGRAPVSITPTVPTPTEELFPPQEITPIALGGLTEFRQITEFPAQNFSLSFNGTDVNYYDAIDGKFYEVTPEGDIVSLTKKTFPLADNVTWAPDRNQTILEFPDGSNILFNIKTEEQVTLPKHWEDFGFAPASEQIALKSLGVDDDQRWLAVSEPDGSKTKLIEHLGFNDAIVTVDWSPNNQIVAYYAEPKDGQRQDVYFIGLNDENYKSMTVEGYGFEGQWSPKGDRMLYSVYNANTSYNPTLWIVNAEGDQIGNNRKPLNVQTWADKCDFSADNTNIYCAIPDNLQEGSGLVPAIANEESFSFYKINTLTGNRELLAYPADIVPVDKVMLSQKEDYLYFTDGATGVLKRVQLK